MSNKMLSTGLETLEKEKSRLYQKTLRQRASVAKKYGEYRFQILHDCKSSTVTLFWTEKTAFKFFDMILPTDSIKDLLEKFEEHLKNEKCTLSMDGVYRAVNLRQYLQFAIEANDFRLLILLVTRNGYDASEYNPYFLKEDIEYIAWKYVDFTVMNFLQHYDRMIRNRVYRTAIEALGAEEKRRNFISIEIYLNFVQGMKINKDNFYYHCQEVGKLGNWSQRLPQLLEGMFARSFYMTDVTDDFANYTMRLGIPNTDLVIDVQPYLRTGPVKKGLSRIVSRSKVAIETKGSLWKNIPLSSRFITNDDTTVMDSAYPLWLAMFEHFLVTGKMMSFELRASKVGLDEMAMFSVEHLKIALTSQNAVAVGKYIGFYPDLPMTYLKNYKKFVSNNYSVIRRSCSKDTAQFLKAWIDLMPQQPKEKQRNTINKTLRALK